MAKKAGSGAGAKDELISIERETRTPDGQGGYASPTVWTEVGRMWAEVGFKGTGEARRHGALRESVRHSFIVYSAAADEIGVTHRDRIVWGGEVYNIRERPRSVDSVDVEIVAEAGVSQ